MLGLVGHAAVAATVDESGLLIDLSRRWLPRDLESFQINQGDGLEVAAVWLPPVPPTGAAVAVRWGVLARMASQRWRAPLLIVDLAQRDLDKPSLVHACRSVEPLRVALAGSVPLAIGLRGGHLEGGRPHLVHLRMLRRLAEEWDLGVAIDLSGTLDQRWEAEAAVARLGSRLDLLVVGSDATEPIPIGRSRVAMRALTMAFEQPAPPHVTIVPRVPPWQWLSSRSMATAYASAVAALRTRARRQRGGLDHSIELYPHHRESYPPA